MPCFTRCTLSTRRWSERVSLNLQQGSGEDSPSCRIIWYREKGISFLGKCSEGRVFADRIEEILDLIGSSLGAQDQKLSELELVRGTIIRSLLREFNLLEKAILRAKEKLEALAENAGYKLRTMSGVDFTTKARITRIIKATNHFSSGPKIVIFCGTSLLRKKEDKKSNQSECQLNHAIHCIRISKLESAGRGNQKVSDKLS